MAVVLLSIGIMALFFVLLSVRLLLIKDGEFRGTCASQSPWLKKEGACGYCGKDLSSGEACGKDDVVQKGLPQIKKKNKLL
jgi:hypothetical protein